jgi:hypothetical protein
MSLLHFLIVYNTKLQELIEATSLGTNGSAAGTAYAEKEREFRDRDDIEIVLIGADSLDTIRQTHPHYFGAPASDFYDTVTP